MFKLPHKPKGKPAIGGGGKKKKGLLTAVLVGKAQWKIEIRTGDVEPYPEWLELRGYGQRYRYIDRDEAEAILAKLQRIQPHGRFRVSPLG